MRQEAVRELSRADLQAGGDRAALSHIHTQTDTQVTPDRSLTRQSINPMGSLSKPQTTHLTFSSERSERSEDVD